MPSPYALDFSPINEALEANRQFALAKNKLAMEQERLGWEREMQPFKVQQVRQEVAKGADELQRARFQKATDYFDTYINAEGITPDEKAARWSKFLQSPIFKDDSELAHPMYGQMWRDPTTGPAMFNNVIAPSRLDKRMKEAGIAGKEAESKKDTAQAGLFDAQREQSKFLPIGENAQGVFDTRTRTFMPVGDGNQTQRIIDKAAAKERGEAQGKAQVALPEIARTKDKMLRNIDELIGNDQAGLKQHPGLNSVIGPIDQYMPTFIGLRPKQAADAQARVNEVLGGTFLEAYNSLRGAGAITEGEGRAAINAYNRLKNTGVGEKDWIRAAKEFRNEVVNLYAIAEGKSRGSFAPISGQATGDRVVKPNTDRLPEPRRASDGNYYIPDPNRPGKYLRVDQ